MAIIPESLPHLCFEIIEAARILRISRATLHQRIRSGVIATQKDGRCTYITVIELHRHVTPSPRCTNIGTGSSVERELAIGRTCRVAKFLAPGRPMRRMLCPGEAGT